MVVAPPRLCNNGNGIFYKEVYSPNQDNHKLGKVNLSEGDEFHIGIVDNRSTNTCGGRGL